MKKIYSALVFDGLAILLAFLGYNSYQKAEVLKDFLDNPVFGELNQQALDSYTMYYTLEFIGAGFCFLIAAFLLVKYVKTKKAQMNSNN